MTTESSLKTWTCYNALFFSHLPMVMSLRTQFWKTVPIDQFTTAEWEALCDGCGLCCLVKLEDEDLGDVAYTKVACKLMNCQTGQCQDYAKRQHFVPDCIQLSLENLPKLHWLPPSCAYKRIYEGKSLPSWHYLNTGSRKSVIKAKKSVAGRCISELDIDENDIDEYIVNWVR